MMLKRIIFLFLAILVGCNNHPPPKETTVRDNAPAKPKAVPVKPAPNPWAIRSYAPKEGETEGKKFVKFVTEGSYSDSLRKDNYLYAEIVVSKTNAGIFLHEMKKTNPSQLFTEPVSITMTNSSGQELRMTSNRRWNSSGGISIERNTNDYSQFRIFLLQSNGRVMVEIKDAGTKTYSFSINADGFSESFSRI
jgi:hypothetical protein